MFCQPEIDTAPVTAVDADLTRKANRLFPLPPTLVSSPVWEKTLLLPP